MPPSGYVVCAYRCLDSSTALSLPNATGGRTAHSHWHLSSLHHHTATSSTYTEAPSSEFSIYFPDPPQTRQPPQAHLRRADLSRQAEYRSRPAKARIIAQAHHSCHDIAVTHQACPAIMAVPRRAPYKDFLQPALQRRFASTVGVLLGAAYLESLTLSSWNSRTSIQSFAGPKYAFRWREY